MYAVTCCSLSRLLCDVAASVEEVSTSECLKHFSHLGVGARVDSGKQEGKCVHSGHESPFLVPCNANRRINSKMRSRTHCESADHKLAILSRSTTISEKVGMPTCCGMPAATDLPTMIKKSYVRNPNRAESVRQQQ